MIAEQSRDCRRSQTPGCSITYNLTQTWQTQLIMGDGLQLGALNQPTDGKFCGSTLRRLSNEFTSSAHQINKSPIHRQNCSNAQQLAFRMTGHMTFSRFIIRQLFCGAAKARLVIASWSSMTCATLHPPQERSGWCRSSGFLVSNPNLQ